MSQLAETATAHPRVCPFLTRTGLAGPPVLQPDADHRCALADVDSPPRRDIQVRYCLGGRHTLCPAFAAQAAAAATIPSAPPRRLRALALLAIVTLLFVMGSLVWYGQQRFLDTPAAAAVPTTQATAPAVVAPEAITAALAPATSATLADQPAPSLTLPPSPSDTPSLTPTAKATPSPSATSAATIVVNAVEPAVTVEATAEISFMALPSAPTPSPEPLAMTPTADPDDEGRSREPRQPRPLPSLPRQAAIHPPDRIVAASIGLDAPVVPVQRKLVDENGEVTEVWEVADNAAGWHEGSALPGQPGNIVLSGHHNIQGQVFRYVERLKPGDEVVLYADGRAFRYVVQLKMIVKEKGEPPEVRQENARWIGPFPDERLTLVTCWPYTSNTHRVIVVARPVSALAPADRPIPPAAGPSG